MGVGGQCHALALLPPGKTQYLLYSRLGGIQARLDGCGKFVPTGIRSPDRAACSKSLYWLHYPRLQCTDTRKLNTTEFMLYSAEMNSTKIITTRQNTKL